MKNCYSNERLTIKLNSAMLAESSQNPVAPVLARVSSSLANWFQQQPHLHWWHASTLIDGLQKKRKTGHRLL
jgi:hypothetical protein